jgi:regulator of replication initiation timing
MLVVRFRLLSEQQQNNVEVSFVVEQALGKLNVRLADLMEQINAVIEVLVDENVELRIKLDKLQT